MQNYGKWLGAGAIVVTSLVGVTGCADRNKNGQPDSAATSSEIANSTEGVASNVAGAVDNTVDAAANKVSGVDDAVANAAKKVENAGDALATTPKVKTALGANPSLAGSNINVTTNNNQVILSGTVKNAAQKNLAGSIATKNGNGYKVVNNLKVAGGVANKM